MAIVAWFDAQLSKQVGQVFPWAVVCFGFGIWLYFLGRSEPSLLVIYFGLICAVLWVTGAYFYRFRLGLICVLPALILMGYVVGAVHALNHRAPVLNFHYYGPIYGRVIYIDRSSSHAVRLMLDQVRLSGVPVAETPIRVRVSLHGPQEWLTPIPGQHIGLTGFLAAPNGPVEPGGFDFQRHAWFLRLGAVGYTRNPALEMSPPQNALPIGRMRHHMSRHVSNYLGGDIGGFAAAVTTGDRSAFSQEAIQVLRVSNLAHLLAISGLHMGLLAAFLFAVFRFLFALWQPLALRLPAKRIAALAALTGATAYLLLSGASIATQRAYIMAAVALLAVCLDRRALTLRAVAIAAFIVLLLRPSSLLSPGFQMSFAATTALVTVFSATRQLPTLGLKRWQKSFLTLVLSSLVAGLATAPFAAAHFNQWAAYGLLANVTAVPAMGMIVIPGAVLAAVLSPFGASWVGLEIMGLGLQWILLIAHWVSALEGARLPIVTPHPAVLPLICLGGCWLVLWQGRLRWVGSVALICALLLWSQTKRPDVLIAADGKLLGAMTEEGRALSKAKAHGFVATSWLENDGDFSDQILAARRLLKEAKSVFSASLGPLEITHVQGKRSAEAFTGCVENEIVATDQILDGNWRCDVFDASRLARTGAVAIWVSDEGKLRVETVAGQRGQRLWTPPAQRIQ